MKSLAPSPETVNLSSRTRFHIYTDYQVWIGGSVDGGCHAVSGWVSWFSGGSVWSVGSSFLPILKIK